MAYAKFHRILLAVDDTDCSKKAAEYALAMVDKDTSIGLVTVVSPISSITYGADPLLGQQSIVMPEVTDIQMQVSKEYLDGLSKQFSQAKEVFVFDRIGNVKEEILAQAKEWSADLIIMGSSGKTGFDLFISGSVSESIVRNAVCPVLVIPSKCD